MAVAYIGARGVLVTFLTVLCVTVLSSIVKDISYRSIFILSILATLLSYVLIWFVVPTLFSSLFPDFLGASRFAVYGTFSGRVQSLLYFYELLNWTHIFNGLDCVLSMMLEYWVYAWLWG